MSSGPQPCPPQNERAWRTILVDGDPTLKRLQRLHGHLPSPPRCKLCLAPFRGAGSLVMRLVRRGPASGNPRYCGTCDRFLRACPGGTEVNLSLIFVDVRGSVALAERLQPADYSRHLAGFFRSATQALLDTNGFLIEFRGDSVVGVYPPGLAGPDHPRKAVAAACGFLRAVAPQKRARTALPIGVGAHTGTVYVCTVNGSEGSIQDIGIFGDAANVAARLSQMAEPGEALISDALCTASGMPTDGLETRRIALKGRRAGSTVYVLRPQA